MARRATICLTHFFRDRLRTKLHRLPLTREAPRTRLRQPYPRLNPAPVPGLRPPRPPRCRLRGGPAATRRARGSLGTGSPGYGGRRPGTGRGSAWGHVCRCLERVLDWGLPGPGREGPGAGLRLGFVQRTRANRESQGPGSGGKGLSQGSGPRRVGWRRAGDRSGILELRDPGIRTGLVVTVPTRAPSPHHV